MARRAWISPFFANPIKAARVPTVAVIVPINKCRAGRRNFYFSSRYITCKKRFLSLFPLF
jgi:hypothetical protein